MTVRVPAPGETQIAITLDSGTGGEARKRTQLVLDGPTGQVLQEQRFGDLALARRLRGIARFVHTGEEGGLPGQVVAAIASAGGVLLVCSGLSLAVRRLVRSLRPG